jgi:hypothetical protein
VIVIAVIGKRAPGDEVGFVAGEGKDRGEPQLEREDQRGGREDAAFFPETRLCGFAGSIEKRGLSPRLRVPENSRVGSLP